MIETLTLMIKLAAWRSHKSHRICLTVKERCSFLGLLPRGVNTMSSLTTQLMGPPSWWRDFLIGKFGMVEGGEMMARQQIEKQIGRRLQDEQWKYVWKASTKWWNICNLSF